MTEAGNPPKTKTGGFPPSLESAIPPRFPHSHRPGGCYIGFKIQGPKAKPERSLSSAPVSSPFKLILQLEKTAGTVRLSVSSSSLSCISSYDILLRSYWIAARYNRRHEEAHLVGLPGAGGVPLPDSPLP